MTSEEKRQEKLLLLLLALATDTERRVFIPQRRRIMVIMRQLRRIVQRMSPTGSFRTYEWARLKPLVLPLVERAELVASQSITARAAAFGPRSARCSSGLHEPA